MNAISSATLTDFGPFLGTVDWKLHGPLNLIIGANATGKTQLLKVLYAVTRGVEEFWRKAEGPQPRPFSEIITDKLLWTFLPGGSEFSLGKLVHRGRPEARVVVEWGETRVEARWGSRASKHLAQLEQGGIEALREDSSTFVPAKELLSVFDAIRATRERSELAAFDDTYYDLFRDFQHPILRGRLQDPIYKALEVLRSTVGGGEVEMDREGRIWWLRRGSRLAIVQAAEGIRKVGVLFRLMRNRRINPAKGGYLFVDEPEAHLHPRAEVLLAEILHILSRNGIQVYVATHSYFVVKRLEQLSRESRAENVLVDLRLQGNRGVELRTTLLRDGLPPDNPIIGQALELFSKDVELDREGV